MLIGYARVSKADGTQLLDLQRDALRGAGVDEERIYEDRSSGRHDHRPGLEACLKALQPGNTFVVWKLDRLGRNLKHLVTTVDELHGRGVGLRVLAGAGAEIDTTTANGRLVFGIFAALAEFERELIAERTRAGLAAARARGRLGGRPRKMDVAMLRMAMHAMSDRNTLVHDLAQRLGITTTEGLGEDARAYLDWLLGECTEADADIDALIEPVALDLMALRLTTPLQFAEHLNRAFEAGFRTGQKPVTAEIVATALAPDFDDLEPRLTRQGY